MHMVDFANGVMRGMHDDEDVSDDRSYQWCCCAQFCVFCLPLIRTMVHAYMHVYAVAVATPSMQVFSARKEPSVWQCHGTRVRTMAVHVYNV